ncbi:hypothetical protein DFJ73DRAFT_958513, partial [Zopfochytrium polystomum]
AIAIAIAIALPLHSALASAKKKQPTNNVTEIPFVVVVSVVGPLLLPPERPARAAAALIRSRRQRGRRRRDAAEAAAAAVPRRVRRRGRPRPRRRRRSQRRCSVGVGFGVGCGVGVVVVVFGVGDDAVVGRPAEGRCDCGGRARPLQNGLPLVLRAPRPAGRRPGLCCERRVQTERVRAVRRVARARAPAPAPRVLPRHGGPVVQPDRNRGARGAGRRADRGGRGGGEGGFCGGREAEEGREEGAGRHRGAAGLRVAVLGEALRDGEVAARRELGGCV